MGRLAGGWLVILYQLNRLVFYTIKLNFSFSLSLEVAHKFGVVMCGLKVGTTVFNLNHIFVELKLGWGFDN